MGTSRRRRTRGRPVTEQDLYAVVLLPLLAALDERRAGRPELLDAYVDAARAQPEVLRFAVGLLADFLHAAVTDDDDWVEARAYLAAAVAVRVALGGRA